MRSFFSELFSKFRNYRVTLVTLILQYNNNLKEVLDDVAISTKVSFEI